MIHSIGIDLGGTNIKAVSVSPAGEVLERATSGSRDSDRGWAEEVRILVKRLEDSQGMAARGIGLCAPGLASADARSIAWLPGKLAGIEGFDWTQHLDRDTLVPVLNDAHAAALGEAWAGAAAARRDVVLLTLGTGVGGAIIANGELLRGHIGRAGHLGHISLDPSGRPGCTGTPGSLEDAIGNTTVCQRTAGRFDSTAALVAAHRAGDSEATEVWMRSIRALAAAVTSFINSLDPEVILIGGGIALAGPDLFGPLAEQLDRIEWRPGGHRVEILPAALGEWAGAIGAAREGMKCSAPGSWDVSP